MGMFDSPQGGMFSSPVGSFFGNMLSGWGDPEAQGAADASNAFHPALQAHFVGIGQQFSDWAQQQQAMNQRLQGQSLSQQALDPEGLQSAMSMALSTGPGAMETPAQKIMRVNNLMARNDMDAAKQGADNFFQNHTSGQIIPAYDAQGNPLPVSPPPIRAYHGSPYDFDAFDPGLAKPGFYGSGIYFHKAEDDALKHKFSSDAPGGGKMYEATLNMQRPFDMSAPVSASDSAAVLDALGQPERAAQVRESGQGYRNGAELWYWGMGQQTPQASRAAAIKDAGFDSIVANPNREMAGTTKYSDIINVLDPKIIDILRKYGLFAPLVGGAAVAGNQQ